ncbi:carbohydrate ABC transporter permease [Eleftheria terrae]|uniref:carbohydrate ABC transporter permease n=1 Tax=Eleftheria terrae TaxID=1597781 RepID=UPI00263BCF3F|nr:carbohydrate ABC transporter permease [Eleftheria terrae]WKB55839.1 carbohydrate ABC transporter permease [Eleftheria terrae]
MHLLPNETSSRWWTLARLPLLALVVSVLLPYYWMAIGAFKTVPELVQQPPTFIVERPTLQNFHDRGYTPAEPRDGHWAGILQHTEDQSGFLRFYLNSLGVTLFVTAVSLLAASLVAFVLVKRPFPGSRLLFNLLLASMMVPWEVTIIPNFITVTDLGWISTYQALLVPGLAKAFVVFYFRQIMLSLSNDLIDAATMDGAGTLRIWWSIVLPITRPSLAAIGIPVAIAEWNNFLWPLLVVNESSHMTLPLMLGKLAGNLTFDPQSAGVLMAGSLLVSLPAIVAFLAFQRQFIDGLTAGASKG